MDRFDIGSGNQYAKFPFQEKKLYVCIREAKDNNTINKIKPFSLNDQSLSSERNKFFLIKTL